MAEECDREEEVLNFSEVLLDAFWEDPRVISAVCENGIFKVDTIAGLIEFRIPEVSYDA